MRRVAGLAPVGRTSASRLARARRPPRESVEPQHSFGPGLLAAPALFFFFFFFYALGALSFREARYCQQLGFREDLFSATRE